MLASSSMDPAGLQRLTTLPPHSTPAPIARRPRCPSASTATSARLARRLCSLARVRPRPRLSDHHLAPTRWASFGRPCRRPAVYRLPQLGAHRANTLFQIAGRPRVHQHPARFQQGRQARRLRRLPADLPGGRLDVSDQHRLERAEHQPPHRLGLVAVPLGTVRHRARRDDRRLPQRRLPPTGHRRAPRRATSCPTSSIGTS